MLAFVVALLALIATRLLILVVPYRWWRRMLRPEGRGRRRRSSVLTPARVSRAIGRSARIVPGSTCLAQAIAARALLSLSGHPSTLSFGVKAGSQGGVEAHAWVTSQGAALVGVPPTGVFVTLASTPATGKPPETASESTPAPDSRADARPMMRLAGLLIELHDLFAAHEIPVIGLKGPLLSQTLHGGVWHRSSNDLDLLVAPEDMARASAVLQGTGFEDRTASLPSGRAESNRRRGCEATFVRGWAYVEVHWRLAPVAQAFDPPFAELWERRELVPLAGRSLAGLGREDLLVYLCVHGGKHLWDRGSWLADVATLVQTTPGLDWDRVLASADEYGARRRLAVGLTLAARRFGVEHPGPVLSWLSGELAAATISRLLERRLGDGSRGQNGRSAPPALLPSAFHLLQVLLLDTSTARARYLGAAGASLRFHAPSSRTGALVLRISRLRAGSPPLSPGA